MQIISIVVWGSSISTYSRERKSLCKSFGKEFFSPNWKRVREDQWWILYKNDYSKTYSWRNKVGIYKHFDRFSHLSICVPYYFFFFLFIFFFFLRILIILLQLIYLCYCACLVPYITYMTPYIWYHLWLKIVIYMLIFYFWERVSIYSVRS